jgi:murein endopeptidase
MWPHADQQADLLTSMPGLLISDWGMPVGMGHMLTGKAIC